MIFAEENFWGRSLAAVSASTDPSCFENYGPFVPGFQCIPYDDLNALEVSLFSPYINQDFETELFQNRPEKINYPDSTYYIP